MDQGQQNESQKVEIWISARDLADEDILSMSDPKCKVYMKQWNEDYQTLGKTECIKDTVNPDWKTLFKIDFNFAAQQELYFKIVDVDDNQVDNDDDTLGKAQIMVSELVGAQNNRFQAKLYHKGNQKGSLIIYVSKQTPDYQFINWKWEGDKIDDKDFFSKSDPQLILFKQTPTETWEMVYKSEVIQNDLSPSWKPFQVGIKELTGTKGIFKAKVMDFESETGQFQVIGEVEAELQSILSGETTQLLLKDPESNGFAGKLNISEIELRSKETFIDYLIGGYQLSLSVAIDFTFSNGLIDKEDSLHRIEEGFQNSYEIALKAIGQILIGYDYDHKVNLYGFGGAPKLENYTKDYMDECFPLNGNEADPSVKGLKEMIETYRNAVQNVELSGPTLVNKILETVKQEIAEYDEKDIYKILIIFTDGQIEDMEDAIKNILSLCELPISIIIIGIGDEDFTYMKFLDSSEEMQGKAKGNVQYRDLIQFVAFKELENDPKALCEKILKELPKQFMQHMKRKNKRPKGTLLSQFEITE